MADIKSTSTNNTRGSVSLEATQKLLDQALAQEPTKRTCKDDYGKHEWVTHEETLMEYCAVCKLRKDRWVESKGEIGPVQDVTTDDLPKNGEITDKTAGKPLENVPEQLRPHVFKEGEPSANPRGRPPGSKNLTTLFREVLRNKVYTLKDEATGKTLKISGETALVEKALENAIKKGDRESIRMIWEMFDGKPTQQHKIEVNGPKGYQVDPDREKMIHEQFGMYDDQIPMLGTPLIAPQPIKEVEMVQSTEPEQNTPPTPQNTPNEGVQEPPITYDNTQQSNTGVRENTPSQTGGVREA
jgi:hypothetical protein